MFTCDTKIHDIQWGEQGVEETTTYLSFHCVGKLIGKIDIGNLSLSQFAADAAAFDSSSDPFFGPGMHYILMDSKGRHFILFFEYEEGHLTFNGFRLAINEALLIDSKVRVYKGSPYAGTSFDKVVLAQLKALTQKEAVEQDDAGQPDTEPKPKPKSENGNKPQSEAQGGTGP